MTQTLPLPQLPLSTPLRGRLPKGLLQLHASTLMQLHQLLDPLIVALMLPLGALLLGLAFLPQDGQLAVAAALVLGVLTQRSPLYRSQRLDTGRALVQRVLRLWMGLFGILMTLVFLLKSGPEHSRQLMLLWAALSGSWLLLSHVATRALLRQLRRLGRNERVDAYVGTEEGYGRLQQELAANPWLGQRLVPVMLWPENEPPTAEELEQGLQRAVASLGARQWLLDDCGSTRALRQTLAVLEEQNQPVLMVPHWLSDTSYAPRPSQLGELPAVVLWQVDPFSLSQLLKLIFDRLAACVLLVVLSPMLLAIAALVALESPGPVLFRQRRYGLNGEPFLCLKFRTMRVVEDGDDVRQATRRDPRVTAIGRRLRRWNLDELPQLLNVLRGEMSLVGPRPHAAAHNEHYRRRVGSYMRRHALRPGLTGLAQVRGLRGETDTLEKMERRVKADLTYIQSWSLLLDLKILVLTLLHWRSPQAY